MLTHPNTSLFAFSHLSAIFLARCLINKSASRPRTQSTAATNVWRRLMNSCCFAVFHFHLLHQLKKVWHQQLAVSVTGNHQCTTNNAAPVWGCHTSLRLRSAIREVLLQHRLHVCLLHMYYRHNLVPRPHIRHGYEWITSPLCSVPMYGM